MSQLGGKKRGLLHRDADRGDARALPAKRLALVGVRGVHLAVKKGTSFRTSKGGTIKGRERLRALVVRGKDWSRGGGKERAPKPSLYTEGSGFVVIPSREGKKEQAFSFSERKAVRIAPVSRLFVSITDAPRQSLMRGRG